MDARSKESMMSNRHKCITMYTCKWCFKTWKGRSLFLKHLQVCKSKGSTLLPKYVCKLCMKNFTYHTSFQNHACKKKMVFVCPSCNKEYLNRKCFTKHKIVCGKQEKQLNLKGFRRKPLPSNDQRETRRKGKFEYICTRCGKSFLRFKSDRLVFHQCSEKLKTKRDLEKNLYKQVVLSKKDIGKHGKNKCFNCGKIFPNEVMCFEHYRKKNCRQKNINNAMYRYYKCNCCGKYYALLSILKRHLRDHMHKKSIKEILKKGSVLRGGGGDASQDHTNNASPRVDDSEENDIPLAHLAGNDPILPEKWGWTVHVINLNTPQFDSALLSRLIINEIKSQISARRHFLRNEIIDNGDEDSDEDEEDVFDLKKDSRFSTLSMIALLKVYFYKMKLSANLGEEKQNNKHRKPLPTEQDKSQDEDETIVDAYFHSNPVRLLTAGLEEEVHFIVENFSQQIDEYTELQSGLRLFQVSQCELSFYTYEAMSGSHSEEKIPPHCYMTLHALYSHGKILHISYENISHHIAIEVNDVYSWNCFSHVLSTFNYLKLGNEATEIPIQYEGGSGFILKRYSQVHVKDVMTVEKHTKSLKAYDFSMCSNEGRPMLLEDVPKFYRANYEMNKDTPIINVFKLDYIDATDDLMLPSGVDSVGESTRKYVITQYFLARDFEDDNACDNRDVINMLYWKETEHFYLICNLKALILQVNFNNNIENRSKQRLCYVCMNLINISHRSMNEHMSWCRTRSKKQHVKYPKQGANIEKFQNFKLINKLPFFVAADCESSLIPLQKPDDAFLTDTYENCSKTFNVNIKQSLYENAYRSQNYPLKGSTSNFTPVHAHRLNSIGWQLYVGDDIIDFPHKEFQLKVGKLTQVVIAQNDDDEEKLVDEFMNWLNTASIFIRTWLKGINNENHQNEVLERLKRENPQMIKNSTQCIYCDEILDNPVLDHCHLTLRARGMACNACNLKARFDAWNNFRLQVYIHNFNSYDSCFIVKYMKQPPIQPHTRRTRKDVWRCRMKGNKIRQIRTALLDFRDSLDIIPISIGKLSTNLPVKEMKYVNEIKWENEEVTKNIYPYEWVTGVKRFNETLFPSIDKFESLLTGKILECDYKYSLKLYNENCKQFQDWHVHYLLMDVKILLDALIYWQNVLHNEFAVDLLQCHSLPSYAKQSLLKFSKAKLELITDPSIHSLFSDSIKGGLCVTALRSHQVKDQTLESIRYFDIKSLYAAIQKLYRHPTGGYQYLTPTPSPHALTKIALEYNEKESDTGYLCVVDLKIPHKLHTLLSDFPVTYQKMSVDPSLYPPTSKWHHLPKSKIPKLIPSLIDPTNYGVSIMTLQFLVQLGLIIQKVHHVIAFQQEYFLRDFVDICLKKRKESGNKMDDVSFKLICNGLFGKFIECCFKYTDSKFVFNRSDYARILRDASRFIGAKWEKYGVLMTSRLATVTMNKAIACGWSILCKSKAHFQKMFYFEILPSYEKVARPITVRNRLRVMYVDTDSVILLLTLDSDRERKFYSMLEHIFDFSSLPENDRFYSTKNKSLVGIFKDEVPGLLIKSQHSNGAKSYLYTIENNTGRDKFSMTEKEKELYYPNIKLKALSRYFQSTLLTEDDFEKTFDNPNRECRLTYNTLRIGYERCMYTFKCTRKVLDSHDSKRWVYPNQRDSLALGHFLTLDKQNDK